MMQTRTVGFFPPPFARSILHLPHSSITRISIGLTFTTLTVLVSSMQIDDRDGADGDADGPSLLPSLPHRLCRPSLCPFASVLLPHEYMNTAIFAARLQKRSKFLALLGNFLYNFYSKLPQAAMSLGWCWRQTRSLCRFQPCSRTKVRVVRFHLRGDPVIFFWSSPVPLRAKPLFRRVSDAKTIAFRRKTLIL